MLIIEHLVFFIVTLKTQTAPFTNRIMGLMLAWVENTMAYCILCVVEN